MKKVIACLALLVLAATSAVAQSVPASVEQRIRQIYAQKYPDNFSMQKTLVQDQCESYRFLQSYTSVPGVPNTVLSNLKQKYAQKYPYNFSMQMTLVQDQVRSYLELHR